jgi:hypothetical protein
MKNAFLLLAFVLQTAAQPVETRPAAPTRPAGGLPASPTAPGLPASPTVTTLPASPTAPGTAGFTNAGSLFSLTNGFGTNFLPAELGPLLTELQTDLEQLLPVLALVNNNAANLPTSLPATGTSGASVTSPLSGVNLSGNASVDVSSSRGANASANLSTPPPGFSSAPGSTAAPLGTNAATASLVPPSPTGSTNVIGLPPGTLPAAAGTNFLLTPAALNTLNALIILQNDAQRMLPVVAALNGSGINLASVTPTNSGATFRASTNQFTPAAPSRVLTPSRTTLPRVATPGSP